MSESRINLINIVGVERLALIRLKRTNAIFPIGFIKVDTTQCLQNAVNFPENTTLIYSITINGIKNNPITKMDVYFYIDIINTSKCKTSGEAIRKTSDPIDVDR